MKELIILSGLFLALFTLAELLYHKAGAHPEHTRKLVHIGTGLLTMLFPVMLDSHYQVMLLCGLFAIILIISQQTNLLPSINKITRMSYGSLAFPIAVWMIFYVNKYMEFNGNMKLEPMLYYYVPLLTMTLADPAAALVGRKWPIDKWMVGRGTKSLGGSIAFVLAAFILNCGLFIYHQDWSISITLIAAASIALTACVAEFITPFGLDNITIPIVAEIGLCVPANYLL